MVDPARTIGDVGIIRFAGCYASSVAAFGWDDRDRHPLWGLGLRRFRRHRAFEVESSRWPSNYAGFRGSKPLRHLALLFPDTTMEFLVEDIDIAHDKGTLVAVSQRQLSTLGDQE